MAKARPLASDNVRRVQILDDLEQKIKRERADKIVAVFGSNLAQACSFSWELNGGLHHCDRDPTFGSGKEPGRELSFVSLREN